MACEVLKNKTQKTFSCLENLMPARILFQDGHFKGETKKQNKNSVAFKSPLSGRSIKYIF